MLKRWLRQSAWVAALCALSACGDVVYTPAPGKAHHGPSGFVNPGAPTPSADLGSMLSNTLPLLWQTPPSIPDNVRSLVPDIGFLQRNRAENAVTWIGHATVLLQIGGLNVLTDPVFSRRASPVSWYGPRRLQSPGLLIDELPSIDVVFISNASYDRLDEASVREIVAKRDPLFIAPLGVDVLLQRWGVTKIKRMDWWDSFDWQGVQFQLTPSHSWSWRIDQSANQTLWGGLVLKTPGFSFYYAGCTAAADFFQPLGDTYQGFDMAIFCADALSADSWRSTTWLTPQSLISAHRQVRAKQSLAIGWGSFTLDATPADALARALPEALKNEGLSAAQIVWFRPGETGIWRPEVPEEIRNRGKTRDNPLRQWRKGEARPM